MSDLLILSRRTVRRLRGRPGFTALATFTLALGIGATTVVFSVVNSVLLNPLPYPEADRLVALTHAAPGLDLTRMPFSPATYAHYDAQSRTLRGIAVYRETEVNLTGGDLPERLPAAQVTGSLFDVLAVQPAIGRSLTEEDGRPGASRVVVLTDGLWRRRFGTDPEVLSRTLRIDGHETQVVGVLPPDLRFPDPTTQLWLPLTIDKAEAPLGDFSYDAVGRLVDGVTVRSAERELGGLLGDLESAFPGDEDVPVLRDAGLTTEVRPYRDRVVGDVGSLLWNLLGAAGMILAIACANVANLIYVRVDERRADLAMQTALGVRRGGLVADLLAESVVIGVAGGALGLAITFLILRANAGLPMLGLPRADEIGVDERVLVVTLLLSLVSAVAVGLPPALRVTAPDRVMGELRSNSRSMTMDRSRRIGRQVLVGLQMALSVVLLIASGLLMRSLLNLARIDPGFETRELLSVSLSLPEERYRTDQAAAGLVQRLLAEIEALPGVRTAAATSTLPLGGSATSGGHQLEGSPLDRERGPPPLLETHQVSDGYFETLEVPILTGRAIERADSENRNGSVVVSRSLADRFWPGESPLGRRLRPGGGEWYTVVGVAGDVRSRLLTEDPQPIVYYPLVGSAENAWIVRRVHLVVRGDADPELLADSIRAEVRALDPDLPIGDVEPLDRILARSTSRMRLAAGMFMVATAIALLLSAVGIYAFFSYLVTRRTGEIGVRMALGARPTEIRWMVLRETLVVTVVSIVVGLAAAVLVTRPLHGLLVGVARIDPLVFAGVPLVLAAVALTASYVPAMRAARTSPLQSLGRG